MIYIEDHFALREQLDCIIPFTCIQNEGDLVVEIYAPVKNMVQEFLDLYIKDAFSDEAINYIDNKLQPFLNEWGYEFKSDNIYEWEYSYIIDDATMINYEKILPETILLYKNHNFINLTGADIDIYPDKWENYNEPVSYATVVDNRILSIAGENPHYLTDRDIEIGVETATEYREKGYAASNTAALAKHLADKGKRVWYSCSRYNIPSQKTAQSVGFRIAGKKYYYAAYKKED
ncbi:MAG: GNAT family N-acetyltransferase [Eubacteriales bacterium]|nr:GNAT family N-acetyltransferase [Eubacteriales bacterium]